MRKRIKKFLKIIILIVILLSVSLALYLILKNGKSGDVAPETQGESSATIRYFSPGADKIMITVFDRVLYTNNPTTTLSYYATDNSGQLVYFRQGDRAFVRILGVTRLYTNNTEIFHPEKSGSEDYTLFLGNITIPLPGKYLIKVCLGPTINLDSEGTLIWPFGCYDSDTSGVIDIYEK